MVISYNNVNFNAGKLSHSWIFQAAGNGSGLVQAKPKLPRLAMVCLRNALPVHTSITHKSEPCS